MCFTVLGEDNTIVMYNPCSTRVQRGGERGFNTTAYEHLFKIQKWEIVGYLISVGHEKKVIIGYWYLLKRIHIVPP